MRRTGKKIMDKKELIDTACRELLTYGLWDRKTKIKRWVKKNLFHELTDVEDLIFWKTGILAVGLLHCRPSASPALRQRIEAALASYFERWNDRKQPVCYPDDLLAGETFLAIYEEYDRTKVENGMIHAQNAQTYRRAIKKLAEYALNCATDEAGSLPYRPRHGDGHVCVDSVGLVCPFLYEYGRFMEESQSMELAVRQIVNFLAYGMDQATGLPYHGYETRTACKYGIIGWGRAVGWLLRGMAGCMTTAYGEERLRDSYRALADAAIAHQRKDGCFSWQLQAVDGPADTSATGMICAALKRGVELHVLQDAKYERAVLAGTDAVEKSVRDGRVYDCSGECEGFGQYPQRYGAYPWSLGPALML